METIYSELFKKKSEDQSDFFHYFKFKNKNNTPILEFSIRYQLS